MVFQQNLTNLSWEEQCAWYFCRRYVLHKLPGQDVGLNELEEVTMRELETDENLLSSFVRIQGEHPAFSALWELYGHDPALFHQMMDLSHGFPFQSFLPLRHSDLISPYRKEMLSGWCRLPLCKMKLFAETMLLLQEHWDQFESHWNIWAGPIGTRVGEYDYPFSTGLKIMGCKLHERVLKREAKNAISFMYKLNLQSPANHSTQPNPLNQQSEILYLLAAAGSGKTRYMFDLLERNFGFYFVSGAVPSLPANADGELLYHPRASVKSRDAQLLFRTKPSLNTGCTLTYDQHNSREEAFQTRAGILLDSRWRLFCEIISQSHFSIQPGHWLRYQLAFTGSPDPLQSIFHCAMLRGDLPDWIFSCYPDIGLLNSQFLWCFDEVQCDTARVSQTPFKSLTVLSSLVSAFSGLSGQQCGILSGTAMNLKMIQKEVDMGELFTIGWMALPTDIPKKPLDKFPLVTDDKILKTLIRPSITALLEGLWSPELSGSKLGPFLVADESIFTNSEFIATFQQQRQTGGQFAGLDEQQAVEKLTNDLESVEVWKWVAYRAAALRGRYRWSVCFIERLFYLYVLFNGLTANLVHQASIDVQNVAKPPLIQRMRNLENSIDPDRRKVVADIYEMAMQASLFGRSRILSTSQAQILIEEALGYVESIDGENLKVRLVEKLVVDAIMECHPSVSLMDGYLGTWQYRPSSFGFIAEDRLAEAIYISALQERDIAIRRAFLSNFDSVYPISTKGCLGAVTLNLGDYFLECNPGPGAPEPDGDGDVGVWLHQVLHGVARATFLLPKEASGPDLMFVFRKDMGKQIERLVCAVQVRLRNSTKHDVELTPPFIV